MFLNPLLYQDIVRLNEPTPEVFCFDNIDDGIKDFVKITGVKAEKLLTSEESKEIKKELDSLPPLGWLSSASGMDDAAVVLLNSQIWQRASAALLAATANQGWRPGMPSDSD